MCGLTTTENTLLLDRERIEKMGEMILQITLYDTDRVFLSRFRHFLLYCAMISVLVLFDTDASSIDGQIPKSIELTSDKIVLGRGSPQKPVDIVITARKESKEIISRQHAEISRNDNGDFVIKDLNAVNGLFVNSVRILSQVLKHNDIIQFGGLCDAPIGKVIQHSDMCIKYKFMANHVLTGKKRSHTEETSTNASRQRTEMSSSPHRPLSPAIRMHSYPKLELNAKGSSSPEKKVKDVPKAISLLAMASGAKPSTPSVAKPSTPSVVEAKQTATPSSTRNNSTGKSNSVELLVTTLSAPVTSPALKSTSIASSVEPSLPLSILKSILNCALCNNILLDAVVLHCSHGFCRCCIEQHIRKYKSTCPICNNEPVDKAHSSKTTGHARIVYNRSIHLDSLVNELLEKTEKKEVEEFCKREINDRLALEQLGMDPDATVDCTENIVDPQEVIPEKQSDGVDDNNDDSSINENQDRCLNCGEGGHFESECPFLESDEESDEE